VYILKETRKVVLKFIVAPLYCDDVLPTKDMQFPYLLIC